MWPIDESTSYPFGSDESHWAIFTIVIGDSDLIRSATFLAPCSPALSLSYIIMIKPNAYITSVFLGMDVAPQENDILLTSVGTLGIPYRVRKNEVFYFKDGNLTWFRDYQNIESAFLYNWFLSSTGKHQLNKITIGSTQSALTISGLKSIELLLPPINEQIQISDFSYESESSSLPKPSISKNRMNFSELKKGQSIVISFCSNLKTKASLASEG